MRAMCVHEYDWRVCYECVIRYAPCDNMRIIKLKALVFNNILSQICRYMFVLLVLMLMCLSTLVIRLFRKRCSVKRTEIL